MTENLDTLRFPSGLSVGQAKKDAKKLRTALGISHTDALDQLCAANGATPPWSNAIAQLKAGVQANAPLAPQDPQPSQYGQFHEDGPGGQDDVPECYVCGSSQSTPHNPLVAVTGFSYDDGTLEYVHVNCAHRDRRYGFCRFCNYAHGNKVYMADDINDAGECADHEGESVPDYPEDDLDSYIENIQKDD